MREKRRKSAPPRKSRILDDFLMFVDSNFHNSLSFTAKRSRFHDIFNRFCLFEMQLDLSTHEEKDNLSVDKRASDTAFSVSRDLAVELFGRVAVCNVVPANLVLSGESNPNQQNSNWERWFTSAKFEVLLCPVFVCCFWCRFWRIFCWSSAALKS